MGLLVRSQGTASAFQAAAVTEVRRPVLGESAFECWLTGEPCAVRWVSEVSVVGRDGTGQPMLEYLVDLHRVSVGRWASRSLGLLNDWGEECLRL